MIATGKFMMKNKIMIAIGKLMIKKMFQFLRFNEK